MGTICRKKIIWYVISIFSVFLICMMTQIVIEENGEGFSVWDVISTFPEPMRKMHTIQSVFSAGVSSLWFYMIMPLFTAIPLVSCLSDERKGQFFLYEKERAGTLRYLVTHIRGIFLSSAFILLIGLGIYMAVICRYFDMNPVYPEDVTVVAAEKVTGIRELVIYTAGKYAYLAVYSFAVALFISFLVLLYNDLLFDLSLTFVLNYLFRGYFMKDCFLYPILMILVLSVLYILRWRKGDRL